MTNLGIVSSAPSTTTSSNPGFWQSILGSFTGTVSAIGSEFIKGRTQLELQKMQLKNETALQKATIGAYGGNQTLQAIDALNQARILDATERAREAERAAGTTTPFLGGISPTTMMIVAGAVILGTVMISRKKA